MITQFLLCVALICQSFTSGATSMSTSIKDSISRQADFSDSIYRIAVYSDGKLVQEKYMDRDSNLISVYSYGFGSPPAFIDDSISYDNFIGQYLEWPTCVGDFQGTVYIRIIISEEGKALAYFIVKGLDPVINESAVRTLQKIKKWRRGEIDGKAVTSSYIARVRFTGR